MNFTRLAVAALTAWAAFLLIGSVVHGVLLTDLYARQASGVRADPMSSWVGFGVALIGFFAFAYTRTQKATKVDRESTRVRGSACSWR